MRLSAALLILLFFANVALGEPPRGMTLEAARSHWAFRPVADPKPPAVKDVDWPTSDLDRFVLAELEKNGLKPSKPADPRTLLRRVYFDLIGLPPGYEEVEGFAADPGPAKFTTVVMELLAKREYGQRWGRHWLDVARYSDTTEQSVDGERRIPFAHTYRDYVIDALNADKPFDRFVLEQIAADRVPNADLRGLGFLMVGRRFRGNLDAPQLIIDDRIDVIGRGFLGLTLACARCHDHKFDAVSAADYYSLYGILASTSEPLDLPEIGNAPDSDAVKKYRADRAKLLKDYDAHIAFCVEKSNRLLREMAAENLQYLVKKSPMHRTTEGYIPLDTPKGLLLPGGPARWEALLAKHREHPLFRLWHELLALQKEDFAATAKGALSRLDPSTHHPLVVKAFAGKGPATMLDVADIYGAVIGEALKGPDKGLIDLIAGEASPLPIPRDEIAEDLLRFVTEFQVVLRPDGEKAGNLRQQLQTLEATAPVERALILAASRQPFEPRVLIRGEPQRPGAAVPRRFLPVLDSVDARTYDDDGRLQLAKAMASPNNPLTARVIANRVWRHHFGKGLVATPDDFGAKGEPPSHPELLDHLASYLIKNGWSLKKLHRYILTSATWKQASTFNASAAEKDPDNRLLWRASPRRLEFEPLRDAMLHTAGRLDKRMGGHSAPLDDNNTRRAVYGYTDRFRIPALLRNFDVANPDSSVSCRAETTHPLQALFFLNAAFVRKQAEAVLKTPDVAKANGEERVAAVYRRVFSRMPDADEKASAATYLGDAPDDRRWVNLVQALLMTNEFAFLD